MSYMRFKEYKINRELHESACQLFYLMDSIYQSGLTLDEWWKDFGMPALLEMSKQGGVLSEAKGVGTTINNWIRYLYRKIGDFAKRVGGLYDPELTTPNTRDDGYNIFDDEEWRQYVSNIQKSQSSSPPTAQSKTQSYSQTTIPVTSSNVTRQNLPNKHTKQTTGNINQVTQTGHIDINNYVALRYANYIHAGIDKLIKKLNSMKRNADKVEEINLSIILKNLIIDIENLKNKYTQEEIYKVITNQDNQIIPIAKLVNIPSTQPVQVANTAQQPQAAKSTQTPHSQQDVSKQNDAQRSLPLNYS